MTSPTVRLRRRRRLLALASAGLALCIGVSVTSLAAWQQNIGVAADGGNRIGSSLLKIELSLDGGTSWTAASISSNNSISFGSNAQLLTPGDSAYASVLLRVAANSRSANVTLAGASASDPLIAVLRYGARLDVVKDDCKDGTFPTAGSVLVATGSLLTTGAGSAAFTLPAGPTNVAGAARGVCLAVSLPSGVSSTLGGLAASPVWQFVATAD